ncbi:MAG: lycopene cyclase domain-containing protein [Vicingaceae bacterium]|nr:lycopene cyclase domain-containing protein [Vicingaceae bacterium]
MKSYIYLLVNLGTILIPFAFSFHPKLNFYKKRKAILLSILIVGTPFICWDIYYTKMGIWGFNPDYLTGIYFFNLPIEEILFFICIPFACMFTYNCFKQFWPIQPSKSIQWISYKMCVSLFVVGFIFLSEIYTFATFISLSIILFFIQIKYNPIWLARLYTSLIVLIIPFLIVNGILTGTGLENPIVWYNENEIMGFRILTVPLEDFFYGFLLILLNVFFLELFDKKVTLTYFIK